MTFMDNGDEEDLPQCIGRATAAGVDHGNSGDAGHHSKHLGLNNSKYAAFDTNRYFKSRILGS